MLGMYLMRPLFPTSTHRGQKNATMWGDWTATVRQGATNGFKATAVLRH